jgi:hypothetical protein
MSRFHQLLQNRQKNERQRKRDSRSNHDDNDFDDDVYEKLEYKKKRTALDFCESFIGGDVEIDKIGAKPKIEIDDIISISARYDEYNPFINRIDKTVLKKKLEKTAPIDELNKKEKEAERDRLLKEAAKKKAELYKGYHSSDTEDEDKLDDRAVAEHIVENAPCFVRTGAVPKMLSENKETKMISHFKPVFDSILSQEPDDFLTPVKRCAVLGKDHFPYAVNVCKSMISHIGQYELCMALVARWHKSRLMPNINEEMEDLFMLAHVVFSDIKLEVVTNIGYILFDSITNIYDIIKPQLYMQKEYSVSKHRFSVPAEMVEKIWKNDVITFLYSECFYKPRGVDPSGFIAEVVNFAHNDLLHEYSGPIRTNLILAHIYFKLRMRLGNEMEFKNAQLAFKRSIDKLIWMMYAHNRKNTIPSEVVQCIIDLSESIINNDLYSTMSHHVYVIYKEINLERRRRILEACRSKLPPSNLEIIV